MATSATIKTNTTYDSLFWVKWAVQEQSVAGNKTTISWSCGFTPGHQFYSNAVKMSAVVIAGATVYAGGTYSNITDYKDRIFASGMLDIAHNADGSRSFTVGAFSGQVYKNGSFLTASAGAQSFDLDTIPRATVPEMGAVTMGGKATIRLPRASNAFTHTVSYTFGSASGVIARGAGTEAEWTVPESLAAQIPNSPSGVGTLECDTYNGGTLIGSKSITFTAAVPGSMKPSLASGWATVTYDNSGTKASGIAAWVQGYSKAKAAFDSGKIACKHGASVKGYSITYLGKTTAASPYRTETISATSATVRCTVTDSRGLTNYEDIAVTLNEYAPPALVGADLFRSDGECAAADSGTHIAGIATVKFSALGGLNSVRLTGYWKGVGGSYGGGVTMTSGTAGLVTGDVEIATDSSYVAKLVATDSLGNTAAYEENIPTEKVAFHLREGGLGAAFGKAAEEDRVLELADGWKLKIGGKSLFDLIYPVGSVYIAFNDTNPGALFGGKWERIQEAFLWAVGSDGRDLGGRGGEMTHTLTAKEMPAHAHIFGRGFDDDKIPDYLGGSGAAYGIRPGDESATSSRTYYTNTCGAGAAHNNMPPYIQVSMWRRTA